MTDRTSAPVDELNAARVGAILMQLPVTAAFLRHNSLKSALIYTHPVGDSPNPELEFVRDMLTRKLSEIHDEWYGGRFNASRIAADAMDEVIGALEGQGRKQS